MTEASPAYEKATSALLCDCGCVPQSIKSCGCGRAEELRHAIAADAAAGKSGDQIIAAYVAVKGEKILVAPPARGFNLIAWTAPAIGLLGAAVLISLMIRRWRRAFAALPVEPVPPAPVGDDAYLARLRREVDELR
jgi:cytochrome c-type biogenesis protein CcmH/NrfF